MEDRTPQSCRHRSIDSTGESATCGLASFLLDPSGGRAVTVSDAACEACCKTFEPTGADLNPVVASLIYSEVQSMLDSPAMSTDEVARLTDLSEFAERSIPLTLPGEDDLGPSGFERRKYSLDDFVRILPVTGATANVGKWVVAVTTSPRRQSTLSECVRSMIRAGWDDFSLFVDGDMDASDINHPVHQTHRVPAVGAWPNYQLSLLEMLLRDPNADAYMIVQDDTLFPDGPLRQYVERVLWPVDTHGDVGEQIASLYCCGQDQDRVDGWAHFEGRWKYGAVAVVFSRAAATSFVHSPEAVAHGSGPDERRVAGIDDVIGQWLANRGLRMLRPTPSLVEHIGHVSTLWRTARAVGVRAAGRSLLNLHASVQGVDSATNG